MGVYTSSQVTKFGSALPVGIIQVSTEKATTAGGQTAFFIDVRKRAFLPYTRAFFPEIDLPRHGVIWRADKRLLNEIIEKYALINARHRDLIVNVGPLRP